MPLGHVFSASTIGDLYEIAYDLISFFSVFLILGGSRDVHA